MNKRLYDRKKGFHEFPILRISLFIFFLTGEEGCLWCDWCIIPWLAIKVILGWLPLNDMVVEIVGLWIDVYWLDLGLECQFRWLLVLLVRCHSSFLCHDWVEHRGLLWHLGLLHVVLVHLLVQSHHVLLALTCVGLSRLHCLHQAVSIVREVELVCIWRDIHIVVQATSVQGTHLIHTWVEVDVVTSSKGAVGWVYVTLGRWRPKWIEL